VMAGSIDPPNQLDRRRLGEDAQLFVPLTENSVVLPYRDRSSRITGGRAWRFHGDPAEISGRRLAESWDRRRDGGQLSTQANPVAQATAYWICLVPRSRRLTGRVGPKLFKCQPQLRRHRENDCERDECRRLRLTCRRRRIR